MPMVRIRLTRIGRKNAPSYRIIAVDRKAKREGKYIERIGYYNPAENPGKVVYKKDRYKYWISVGAQPSSAVLKLIKGNYKYIEYKGSNKNKQNEKEGKNTATKEKIVEKTQPKLQEKNLDTSQKITKDKEKTDKK